MGASCFLAYSQKVPPLKSPQCYFGQVNQLLEHLKPKPVDCSVNEKWKHFASFVNKLHEMDKLPAIFFM